MILAQVELWFDWRTDAWPLVAALIVGTSCGLLGSVFLLRRAALLGDAVSHSVLPGIAGGLIVAGMVGTSGGGLTGALSGVVWMLLGALCAGLLATALIEMLHRHTRIKSDTALGAVFPAFFAAGIILIDWAGSGAHLDDCVFYGALEYIGSFAQVAPALVCLVLVVLVFTLGYRQILVASFDPTFAHSLGLRRRRLDWILVALLATTVVTAFEAVGAILVIALLVVPPATAYLVTDRFHLVLLIAALLGAASGFLGSWLTIVLGSGLGFETARAPTMAVVASAQFVLALFFAPRRGVLEQHMRRVRLRRRIIDENVLGALYRLERSRDTEGARGPAAAGPGVALDRIAAALEYPENRLRSSARRAVRRKEVATHPDGTFSLSTTGRERVVGIVRAHRLWESYLARELGAAPDHVHAAADEVEHHLQPALIEELDRLLRHPRADPHGQAIP